MSLRSISEERHLFREHFSEKANLLLLQISNFSTLPKNCIFIIVRTGAKVFHILINTWGTVLLSQVPNPLWKSANGSGNLTKFSDPSWLQVAVLYLLPQSMLYKGSKMMMVVVMMILTVMMTTWSMHYTPPR